MVSNVTKKIEVDNTPHPPQLSKFLVVKKLGSRRGREREFEARESHSPPCGPEKGGVAGMA